MTGGRSYGSPGAFRRALTDKLRNLVAQITTDGGKVHPFGSDARDEDQDVELFRRIYKGWCSTVTEVRGEIER